MLLFVLVNKDPFIKKVNEIWLTNHSPYSKETVTHYDCYEIYRDYIRLQEIY